MGKRKRTTPEEEAQYQANIDRALELIKRYGGLEPGTPDENARRARELITRHAADR